MVCSVCCLRSRACAYLGDYRPLIGKGVFYDTVTVYVASCGAWMTSTRIYRVLSRRYDREICVRASVRMLSAQLRSSYLGGYRPLMGRGAFYDTVSVYVVAPG